MPSEVAVLFDSNLSRHPFLGQPEVVYSDLLLCIGFGLEHAVLFLCHISTQRPLKGRKMEQCALLWSATTSRQFHEFLLKISFHMKNESASVWPKNLQNGVLAQNLHYGLLWAKIY